MSFSALSDQEVCRRCADERRRGTFRNTSPSVCLELLCRAFRGKSSEAMQCLMEAYSNQFFGWIVNGPHYAQIQEKCPEIQPDDILNAVFEKLLVRFGRMNNCYEKFGVPAKFFSFIKVSLNNAQVSLLRRCKYTVPLPPQLPMPGQLMAWEDVEEQVRKLLTSDEYLVWECWIFGSPHRDVVKRLISGDFEKLKRQVRRKLYNDPVLRNLVGFDPNNG